MDDVQFERMVARLEAQSTAHPRAYRVKVALLALLGFGVLAVVVGVAGAGLLLLAGLAVAMLATGGKALILVLKLGKLLVLLAVPLWLLVKSSMQALFVRLPKPQGRELTRSEAPALFAALDDMRRRMKGPRFHHVLLTDDVNAAVMQRPAFGLFGWPRNFLLLGLPLLDAMTPAEALAVVAHEYGHLAGSHSRFGAYIYRLRHTWGTVQDLAHQWQGWLGRPLQKLVGWYAPYFNAYTFVLARTNEYQADRAAADLVGADVAAHALKRVNLASPRYDSFLEDTAGRMRAEAAPPADLCQRWATTAREPLPAEQARGWLDRALQRPPATHDTHPGLKARLHALQGNAAEHELPPLVVQDCAAEAWLGEALPELRRAFAQAWQERVAEPWRERHAQYQAQREELDGLKQLDAPDRSQRLRRILLEQDLDPAFDAVAALAAYNAEQADDAPGLFHEGAARLRGNDEAGLALLERSMTLDPEATLPACEQACRYLHERNDERLKAYAQRYQERQLFEATRQAQLRHFDPKHTLLSPDLPAEDLAHCRALIQAHCEHLAEAYLARRVLPVDPSIPTYVIAVKLDWMGGLRSKGKSVIETLAQLDFPGHVFFVVLEKELKPMRKTLMGLEGARLL